MMMSTTMRRALLAGCAAVLGAGEASAQCAENGRQFGYIGITRLACADCTIAPPTGGVAWQFATEPAIARIAAGSPADGRLLEGDVITAVNGESITSQAGARAFARLHPTQPVALTIRRDGDTHNFLIAPKAVCASAELLGMTPSTQLVRWATGYAMRAEPQSTPAPSRNAVSVRAAVPAANALRSQAWVGIAFSCRDCSIIVEDEQPRWSFSTPPVVYSVETGSPAHAAGIRRGDVLTHVDEQPITTADGGRRWASLEPGSVVRVRYRRPSGRSTVQHTARIRVATPRLTVTAPQNVVAAELRALETSIAAQDTVNVRMLRSYESLLHKQQVEQERLVTALQSRVSAGDTIARRRVEEALQAHMRTQQQLLSEQQQLQTRLLQVEAQRSEQSRRALAEITQKITTAQTLTIQPAVRTAEQRLRYSGTLRGAEIEVRGLNPVAVTERGNELVITTHDTTIIVRVPDRRD